MAPIDGRRIVGSRFGFYPVSAIQPAKETALVAFVADSGAERFHSDQQRVAIAIGRDFFYNQSVTGSFAFEPQFIARSAKERDVARFDGFPKRFCVHEADHQNAVGLVILNDGGYQAALLAVIQFHLSMPIKKPAWKIGGRLFQFR